MNAPPFPQNPSIGQWWRNWVWNGVRWVASPTTGLRVVVQGSDHAGQLPYMPSPGLVSVTVELIGGGGGGGGCPGGATATNGSAAGWIQAGGGGGSGGYARITLPAALVRGGVIVTVGAGGAGGTASDEWGVSGQPTTFGGLAYASGGWGGGIGDPGNNFYGKPGAGPYPQHGGGDVVGDGQPGLPGVNAWFVPPGVTLGIGGAGGTGQLGGSGGYCNPAYAGMANPGANGVAGGGGAGSANGTQAQVDGGAGGDGQAIITEFCWGAGEESRPPGGGWPPGPPPWPLPPGGGWPPGPPPWSGPPGWWGPWGGPGPGPGPWPRGQELAAGEDPQGYLGQPEDP